MTYQDNLIPIKFFARLSCRNRIRHVGEPPQMNLFIHNLYSSCPLLASLVPSDPRNARRAIWPYPSVSEVRSISANSKIGSSVIERVSIYMVNVKSFWRLHNKTLQLYKTTAKPLLSIKLATFPNYTPPSTKLFNSIRVFLVENKFYPTKSFTIDNHIINLSGATQ